VEHPAVWDITSTPLYPIPDMKNMALYNLYYDKSKQLENVIFGGRLGTYEYLDMDQVINQARQASRKEIFA
jgi:UDP-galactopyranose mutase